TAEIWRMILMAMLSGIESQFYHERFVKHTGKTRVFCGRGAGCRPVLPLRLNRRTDATLDNPRNRPYSFTHGCLRPHLQETTPFRSLVPKLRRIPKAGR